MKKIILLVAVSFLLSGCIYSVVKEGGTAYIYDCSGADAKDAAEVIKETADAIKEIPVL